MDCRVSGASTIRVLKDTYSVHSRLRGQTVTVRVYAEHLEVWYGQRRIDQMPRLRGENGHLINDRHIIDRRVRKPGAFEHYRYKQDMSYSRYLYELVVKECEVRRANKIERFIKASKLPLEKTLGTFDLKRLPLKLRQQVKILLEGDFVDRQENILAFGKPGSGKTHLLCGLCHQLVRQGRRVFFASCDLMVQELLRAKRDLELDKRLKKYSRFEVMMIDDFAYVKQDREEMEVLFTLLAQRHERGSMLTTSNLPFPKWEVIFKDPMTTAAAIDRLVHHSVILELNVSSYRAEQAG